MVNRIKSYKNKNKRLKKDYQRKNLKNPFFRQKKEKTNHRYKKFFILLSLIIFFTAIWFFFTAPLWKINTLEIKGLTRFDNSVITSIIEEKKEEKIMLIFKRSNIFLFKTEEVVNLIKEKFNLAGVKIKKNFPHKLIIEISERPYSFIYQEKEKLFFSSSDNYLIKELDLTSADREEATKYFIIENKNSISLIKENNRLDIDKDYLAFIFLLKQELDNYPELNIDRFIISDQYFNSIFIKIKDGPQIFINVNDKAREQIERLILVKNTKIKDNFNKLDYIDLRYGDKLYFSPENIIK
jgi:cell division septal protein FtsQ